MLDLTDLICVKQKKRLNDLKSNKRKNIHLNSL